MAQLHVLTPSRAASRCCSAGSLVSGLRQLISPSSRFSASSRTSATSPLACPALRVTCSSEPPPPLQEGNDGSSKQEVSRPVKVEQQQTPSRQADSSLISLFYVNGPAPETINGRMAMLGFVWALVAEKMTGLGVVDQLFDRSSSGLLWFAAVMLLFTLASIIPLTNGESIDTRHWGPFTGKAERWNGRLAMLGFAALVVSEVVRQAPILPS